MAEQADATANEAAEQEAAAALAMLRRGAPDGMDRLIPLVYAELRRVAHRQLAVEPAGHTLSTTALVHEAYLRIADQTRAEWTNRAQFFGLAARAMRRVLVDYARRHQAARRGGSQQQPVALEDAEASAEASADALTVAARGDELLALDEALERLSALDARLGRVVECRFFGGLTEAETAETLGVSQRTVAGDWLMAKGWLYQALRTESE
ncbi:MAG TPA: ECF-type sigma factor [Gemmatimonadaceae bacterium]|jgi:RNA polymerase sigma factor (TIGR02999 family)|nr:ECF-type sigma factor [Gemmatimonadaceae bacterium]